MATHSGVLAWRISETVGPRLWGCTELDMTEATYQQQQQDHYKRIKLWTVKVPKLYTVLYSHPQICLLVINFKVICFK